MQLILKCGDIGSTGHSADLWRCGLHSSNGSHLVILWEILHLVTFFSSCIILLDWWSLLLSLFIRNDGADLVNLKVIEFIDSLVDIHLLLLLRENATACIWTDLGSCLWLKLRENWASLRFGASFHRSFIESLHRNIAKLALSIILPNIWTNLIPQLEFRSLRKSRSCLRSLSRSWSQALPRVYQLTLWCIPIVALGVISRCFWRIHEAIVLVWSHHHSIIVTTKGARQVSLAHSSLALGFQTEQKWVKAVTY